MKKLRKIFSLLLIGVITVTSLFCGAVTASAAANPNLVVLGKYTDKGLFEVKLDKITYKEIQTVAEAVTLYGKGGWCAMRAEIIVGSFNLVSTWFWDTTTESIEHKYTQCLDSKGTRAVLSHKSDFYVSAQTGGFVWYLDPKIKEEAALIDEMTKKSKVKCAGFGLLYGTANGGSDKMGCYDDEGTYYLYDVPAKWDLSGAPETASAVKDITALTISSISSKGYSGKAKKPDVTIKDGSYTLVKGTDYTLSYKNNKEIGTATVTIKGKGNYTGTATATFLIIPPKTTARAERSGDYIKASWSAVSGIDKYQIYYSTDGGKNYKKAGTVAGTKTDCSLKLPAGKTYTIIVRSFKKVDGKKYYSKYSNAVTVK